MSSTDAQSVVIDFLSLPSSYPSSSTDPVGSVETITTHASVIFLAGARAYKLKRAVKYSYLDYGSVSTREGACRAELTLNRRTAPSLYLDVVPVTREPSGAFALDGKGTVLDWVVVMRRFPQEHLFSYLADHRMLSIPILLALTDRVAAFHEGAEIRQDQGGAAGIAAVIAINDENLRRTLADTVPVARIDELRDRTRTTTMRLDDLLERRRRGGRVRQCHGDLHLGNICLIDGEPTLFDCIEFSDLIACTDVLYDLAFLLMDLRFRNMNEACGLVFNRYLDLTQDDDGVALLPFFISLRASVRAHVTAAAADAASEADRIRLLAKAGDYMRHALDALAPQVPRLIAIGGLSGSGKSSVAAAIAGDVGQAPGARVVRSDIVRKQLFAVAPEQRLPAEAYRPDVNEEVYRGLLSRTEATLAGGQSAIIDAVSARPAERAAMKHLADRQGAVFEGIWLTTDADRLRTRIAARRHDASDATVAVVERQLGYDLGKIDWHRLDAGRSIGEVIADARRLLGLPAA